MENTGYIIIFLFLMIFDTHSHCYWDTLEPRIDEIVVNMREK